MRSIRSLAAFVWGKQIANVAVRTCENESFDSLIIIGHWDQTTSHSFDMDGSIGAEFRVQIMCKADMNCVNSTKRQGAYCTSRNMFETIHFGIQTAIGWSGENPFVCLQYSIRNNKILLIICGCLTRLLTHKAGLQRMTTVIDVTGTDRVEWRSVSVAHCCTLFMSNLFFV